MKYLRNALMVLAVGAVGSDAGLLGAKGMHCLCSLSEM